MFLTVRAPLFSWFVLLGSTRLMFGESACRILCLLQTAPNSEEEVEADFMVAFRDAFDVSDSNVGVINLRVTQVLVDSTNSFDQLSRSCGEARFSWLPFPAGQTDWYAHPGSTRTQRFKIDRGLGLPNQQWPTPMTPC